MKKCNCKIMNTLGKYQKIWPWIGAAGYAIDGADGRAQDTKWGKAHYKLRMLLHGAGAGLLCLGAGVHTVQAFATGRADVPSVVSGSVIGSGILGLNYTHAAAKRSARSRARVMHRVFCGVSRRSAWRCTCLPSSSRSSKIHCVSDRKQPQWFVPLWLLPFLRKCDNVRRSTRENWNLGGSYEKTNLLHDCRGDCGHNAAGLRRKRYTCRSFACAGGCEHCHAGEHRCAGEHCPTGEHRCAGANNNGRYGL